MRKNRLLLPLLLICSALLAACGSGIAQPEADTPQPTEAAPATIPTQEPAAADGTEIMQADAEEETEMKLLIGDEEVAVQWEDNESVAALRELAADGPLTIAMSMYGGFEQVGSIGQSLPRSDVQTKTSAGDIVLYAGSQIVIFYGSNSWAYTRLGHVELTQQEMRDLLGSGDVSITLE